MPSLFTRRGEPLPKRMRLGRSYYLTIILFAIGASFVVLAPARTKMVYPAGLDRGDVRAGIFAGSNSGDCCWIGARAEFQTEVPSGADKLILNVFLPAYAAKRDRELFVQIAGAPPTRVCCLEAGDHELVVSLPSAARRGNAVVALFAPHVFQPKQLGINRDERELSMLLRSIVFEDSASGEILERSPALWDSSRSHLPFLMAGAVLALLVTLRRPIFGLIFTILADPFSFAYIYHGKMVTLPKAALVAVAIGLVSRIKRFAPEKQLRTLYLLGGAQLAFVLSMILSTPHLPFHIDSEVITALEYVGAFIVAYAAYRLDPNERAVRIALAVLTVVVAVLAFAQPIFGGAQTEVFAGRVFARAAGPLEGPNQLAGFFNVVIPALVAFAILRRPMIIELVAIAFGGSATIMTFSRAGIISTLIACVFLCALRYFPHRKVVIAATTFVLFLGALSAAAGIFFGRFHGIAAFLGSTGSSALNGGLGSRADLWQGAFQIWKAHPFFGIGAGNFEVAIGSYFPGVHTHANSMFFQVLAEQGIVGLLAMLAVIAAALFAFARDLDEPAALGAVAATIGLTFHQVADCMWIYPKVGLIWWLLLAVAAATLDRLCLVGRRAA